MPATLQPPVRLSVVQRPAQPRRKRLTLEELLRRAAASVERGPVKLIGGSFQAAVNGRVLTRLEKGLMMLMAGGLGIAVWLHAQPVPVSAHALHFQSLAATSPLESGVPRTFAENALQAIGDGWRAETFFACTAPAFWQQGPALHANERVARIERGLAHLSAHGSLIAVLTFPETTAVVSEKFGDADVLAGRIAGQLELADGAVVRFEVRLVQDATTRRWGVVELTIPGFLP